MVYDHRQNDPEFAKQWDEAIEEALDLLHARVWQRCLEGDVEPVYYMGAVVGYIRKFDTKLQIEMLRAYRPDRFKTPGQAPININTGPNLLVLTAEQRARLMDARRRSLALMPKSREEAEERQGQLGTAQDQALTTDA